MEASALKYSAGIGLHGRSPLLRLQSDERLIAVLRKGNVAAFEILVSRYESRLLAFCRHLLGSREDAEDVMQEVMTAAFNAILADNRPINVRPWLYRIARNRSLNHMRRVQTIGVDSMDLHYSDHGASTADKVGEREEFRLLVGDIQELPETQKTALVLREMDALSYEQIAEAMETTVPSVKSLLVRARVSLAEAAEARLLSCDDVRIELGEVAEGLRRRPDALVRRHLRACERCSIFRGQLKQTNRALAALMPIGPFVVIKKLALFHLGHSAGAGSGARRRRARQARRGRGRRRHGRGRGRRWGRRGRPAAASSGGFVSAGLGALATKAAAGIAAAAIVTAGAVEATPSSPEPTTIPLHRDRDLRRRPRPAGSRCAGQVSRPATPSTASLHRSARAARGKAAAAHAKPAAATTTAADPSKTPTTPPATPVNAKATPAGRDQTQSDPTVMPPSALGASSGQTATAQPPASTTPTQTTPPAAASTTTDPSPTPASTTPVTTAPATPVAPVVPVVPVTSPPSQPPTTTPPTDPTGTTPGNPGDPGGPAPSSPGSGNTPRGDPGAPTGTSPQSPTPPATGAGGG